MTVKDDVQTLLGKMGMDDQGFLPQQNCQGCGKPLNRDKNPAELYAGTFTGLCYECERKAAYVTYEFSDGAKYWSHAPHCPSWRRDRETFIAYDDCPECKEKHGRIMVSRNFSQGGPYPIQCQTCLSRYTSHPERQASTAAIDKARQVLDSSLKRILYQAKKHPDQKEKLALEYIKLKDDYSVACQIETDRLKELNL